MKNKLCFAAASAVVLGSISTAYGMIEDDKNNPGQFYILKKAKIDKKNEEKFFISKSDTPTNLEKENVDNVKLPVIKIIHSTPNDFGNYQIIVRAAAFSTMEQEYPTFLLNNKEENQKTLPLANSNAQKISYDYYHISLEGQFTPKETFSMGEKKEKEHERAHIYSIKATPYKYVKQSWEKIDNNNNINIFKSSPLSEEGEREITSTINLSVNGSIGTNGTSPSLSVQPGFTFSHSKKMVVKDVKIENKMETASQDSQNLCQPRWDFIINNATKNPNTTSAVSVATYKPYMQWVWRVNRNNDGIYCNQEYLSFEVQLDIHSQEKHKLGIQSEHPGVGIIKGLLISIPVPDPLSQEKWSFVG